MTAMTIYYIIVRLLASERRVDDYDDRRLLLADDG